MAQKLLKYGIGIFSPETPAGFDRAGLGEVKRQMIVVPAGEDFGTVGLEAFSGAREICILMGAGSSARFVERGGDVAREVTVELVMAENARAEYLAVSGAAPAEFIRRRARLAAGAQLKWIDFCFNAQFSRAAVSTSLEGEGASVKSRGIYFGAASQQYDFDQEVLHLAPRTHSDLKIRGVLKGKSKAIVRGLIRIAKDARGCTGFQKQDALLLSEGAEADAVPKLEIENDEVKCGHSASAGRVDEEKLFYLMSRGLDRKAAVSAVIEGFLAPVFGEVRDAILAESLERAVIERLND